MEGFYGGVLWRGFMEGVDWWMSGWMKQSINK